MEIGSATSVGWRASRRCRLAGAQIGVVARLTAAAARGRCSRAKVRAQCGRSARRLDATTRRIPARIRVIFCAPLLGQFTVRRLRFDITGKTETPIELMKRSLTFGDKPLLLSGGSCHEFIGLPGVASAFVQPAAPPPLPICQSGASAAMGPSAGGGQARAASRTRTW